MRLKASASALDSNDPMNSALQHLSMQREIIIYHMSFRKGVESLECNNDQQSRLRNTAFYLAPSVASSFGKHVNFSAKIESSHPYTKTLDTK